jgi:hypothetical protein
MKSMNIHAICAALLVGAAFFPTPDASAGSCCGGGSGASLSVPKYARAVADLSLDAERYDGFWNREGRHVDDPPGSDLWQYRLNLGLGYRFATDWQLALSLPYVWNDTTYSGVASRTDGLGDASISLSYDLVDDLSTWKVRDLGDLVPAVTLGALLTLPTGISPYDDVASSFDVTGRGFYRLDGTLQVEKAFRPWHVAVNLAYGAYLERTVNREYGKYVEPYRKQLGDRASATAALGYTLILGTGGDSLTGTVTYGWLQEDDARYDGTVDRNSGFRKQSLGGSLTYAGTDSNWGVRASWNHALQQAGWGRNFPTTDIFSLGVRYVFL